MTRAYGAGSWKGLDKQALEGCLGVAALALGVVMAGTGHLPTLKLLRGTPLQTTTLSKVIGDEQSVVVSVRWTVISLVELDALPPA